MEDEYIHKIADGYFREKDIEATGKLARKYLEEQEAKNKGCRYCTQGESIEDPDEFDFHVYLDRNEPILYVNHDMSTNFLISHAHAGTSCLINYCPMCGRKLSEAEK